MVQRFYRLDQSRTTPGSGLGLSLVFAVLKLHKLKLKFANNKPGLKVRVTYDEKVAVRADQLEMKEEVIEVESIETMTQSF